MDNNHKQKEKKRTEKKKEKEKKLQNNYIAMKPKNGISCTTILKRKYTSWQILCISYKIMHT